jgi:lysozyme
MQKLTNKQKVGVAGVTVVTGSLLTFVSIWEGTEYVPYKDIVGVWTVCQGITGKHVIPGKIYTREECRDLLTGNVEKHGQAILACITKPIKQNEYEAVASLAYNVGVYALCNSTLIRKINEGQPASVWCQELLKWNRAGGAYVKGLARRRQAELALCLQGE